MKTKIKSSKAPIEETKLKKYKLRFSADPLKQRVIDIQKQNDIYLAQALSNNLTSTFLKYIKFAIDRNENVILNIAGRTRSGKSLAALSISTVISNYTKVKLDVNKHICFNDSEFFSRVQGADFHEIFIIDEAQKGIGGIGSMMENMEITDFQRICAKKCIHRLQLVGDYSTLNSGAFYKLVTHKRDFARKITRLLLYNVEDENMIPLGFIDVPIKVFVCKDLMDDKVGGCIHCPKYSEENCEKYGSGEEFIMCEEQLSYYERLKDTNIDKITEGGLSERQMVRFETAEKVMVDKKFLGCKNDKQRRIVLRQILPNYSNRKFTEMELTEIVEITKMITEDKKEEDKGYVAEKQVNLAGY